jgi:hypothetical protein
MCLFLFLEKSPLVMAFLESAELEEWASWIASLSSIELEQERGEVLVSPQKSSEQNPLSPTHSQKALAVLQVLREPVAKVVPLALA